MRGEVLELRKKDQREDEGEKEGSSRSIEGQGNERGKMGIGDMFQRGALGPRMSS